MSFLHKLNMVFDSLFGRIFFDVTIEDYFQYEFYKKNWYGRSCYYTWGKRMKLTSQCNDVVDAMIFKDKTKFPQYFGGFMGRDSIDMRSTTKDEFIAFAKGHDRVFVKPIDGSFGVGTSIEDCDSHSVDALFSKLTGKPVIVEQLIKQHKELAQFNNTSTNSLRVVTFIKKNGTSEIMPGAILRLGRKGNIADNFHHRGIAAYVDLETGIICSKGIDKEGNRYVLHPDTKIPIVGFKIPQWEQIKEVALKASSVCPTVRCVGWDITVTEEGRIVIIEGNDKADPDIAQMSSGEGVWHAYKSCM